MAKVAITEQYLTDIADAIRAKTGMSTATYYPSQMASAIMTISGSGGITPTGTISITENGTYNVTQYASANVAVPTGSTINNQNKTVTPTESSQTITADSGYTGLGEVTVGAISSTYVGSGITTDPTPTASGATVTIPTGYYSTQTTKSVTTMTLPTSTAASATSGYTKKATVSRSTSIQYINIAPGYNSAGGYYEISAVANGTAGTPTATKGTVSNNSISITPSVTNTTGYIIGSTKTGTAVTVSASELVSGNKAISANGTNIDVTNYATVSVSVPTGSTISNQDKTVNPSTSQQEITADTGYTGLGTVTVTAMPSMTLPTTAAASATSGYTSKLTIGRSTSDQYINIPTGYNSAGAYYKISAVANGSATGPSSLSASSATITTGTNTITLTKTGVTTTPTVSAGYVSSATASTATVALTASVTVNPTPTASGATVTIPAGYYSTQTTKSVSSGTEGTPTATKGTVSNNSISVTPSVTNTAGYISGGIHNGTAVTVSASELVSGNKEITENGTNIDVTNYATVSVNVEGEGGSGGYIYQDANGYIVLSPDGEGGGGSNTGTQTSITGTFTGNNSNTIQISCAFEPREIYIRGDLTSDATLRGIVSFSMIKDELLAVTNDSSTSSTTENTYIIKPITGFNGDNSSTEPYTTYSNGTLTIDTVQNSSSARWASGITYSYTLVGFATPTEHTIHLEFSDSSETDISLNYDNSLIGTMVTSYEPSTWIYNSKTVVLAELDGTTWYDKLSIPLNTQLVDFTKITDDTVINSSGQAVNEQYYYVTDYTPIAAGMTFTFSGCRWYYAAFYNSSKTFISSFVIDSATTPSNVNSNIGNGTLGSGIPVNAAYIRITGTGPATSDYVSLIRTA